MVAAVAPKPINLLSVGLPVATAAAWGVRRISLGGSLASVAYNHFLAAATEIAASIPGGKVTAELLDLRDSAACAALVEKIYDRTGRIDLLVNNAGVVRDNPLTAFEDAEVRDVLETNVIGTFNITRMIHPSMQATVTVTP